MPITLESGGGSVAAYISPDSRQISFSGGSGASAAYVSETVFQRLAAQWRNETGHLSSISKKTKHPAYRAIVAMGPRALPWILRELRDRPGQWFAALNQLSNEESPVPSDERSNPAVCRHAWLLWGKNKGLI